MPHFWIPHGGEPGELIRLASEEAHHLRDVLRIKPGKKIRLIDGKGFRYVAEIKNLSNKEATVLIRERFPKEVINGALRVGQALLKREKMEMVIQKAVELGVHSFSPFSSSRTVVSVKGDEKLSRWRKIADEASKQCGRGTRMIVESPMPFHRILESEAETKIIFWEEGGEPVRQFFVGAGFKPAPTQTILALIGPEGGFSREEIDEAKGAGFTVLSLGRRILRAETAAIVAMSLIQYELENF